MINEEKLNLLINKLKEYAEREHCYDGGGDDLLTRLCSYNDAFEQGANYGETLFARTMLESMGVKFEYPCMMKEND